MNYLTIRENEEVEIEDYLAPSIIKMLSEESQLPIIFENNIMSFTEYTVGSIQIEDLVIEILPRNPVFTLEKIFEMLLFENITNFDEKYLTDGFGENQSFGFAAVTSQFYFECNKLVKFGLTGNFVSDRIKSKEISGIILLEQFHRKKIPMEGITFSKDVYTVNIVQNQIIKSAIIKVLQGEFRPEIRKNYKLLLKNFSEIDDYGGSLHNIDQLCDEYYSANHHYPIVLEFAVKILKEMKIKFTGGKLSWYSFLHNSNDIFEKYIRKVVSQGIGTNVSKWGKAKEIAYLSNGIREGYKSFVPDILIDYNQTTGKAKAVLDVKNKRFNPNKGNLSDVLSSADMYQMTFYCDKLNTRLGGLIYPAEVDNTPISVLIDANKDFRFVLFSINMSERISLRHRVLNELIKEHLLYYV